MCVVIAKYFEKHGWVGIKNRDRNYIPEISFRKKIKGDTEVLYFWDNITQYCEGMNSHGVSILSASLMVLDDEKEVDNRSKTPSKDGARIEKALLFDNVIDAAKSLIDQKLTGHTLIFDADTCYILEGAWRKGEYKSGGYSYTIDEVPKNQFVARTNHGVKLGWSGYQRDDNISHALSRISSECRREIAEFVTERATTPDEILDGLTENFTGNGQLNALRTSNEKKKMRTTSQTLIIPKSRTMYVRPVQSNITFNFWDLNKSDSKTWIEILSNRVLYDGKRDPDFEFQTLSHTL